MKKERWWVLVLHLGMINVMAVLVEDLVGLEVRIWLE